MTAGVIVDDAIAWESLPGQWVGESKVQGARLGEWSAIVWRTGSGSLPWRAKLRRNENDYRSVRSYRTEERAKLATGARLRKAAS